MDNTVDGPTAQDVARHHGRWNTGSAVLALYTHDWKFSVPLKHFLCRPHSQRVPGNSVALAGRSLWRLGAHAIIIIINNNSCSSSRSIGIIGHRAAAVVRQTHAVRAHQLVAPTRSLARSLVPRTDWLVDDARLVIPQFVIDSCRQWRSYEFFSGRNKIWWSGDGILPVGSRGKAPHPKADDCIIIMCWILTTRWQL